VSRLFHRSSPKTTAGLFRRLQLSSAALYSLGHGTNDAQKTMGVVALILFNNGYLNEFMIPIWVKVAAGVAISLGTMAGGWRIVKTMGMKITKLQPVDGFCAETSAAISHYPYHHRRHRWGGLHPPAVGRAMGGHFWRRLGMGADHPRLGCGLSGGDARPSRPHVGA
jgi:hypothetical protein